MYIAFHSKKDYRGFDFHRKIWLCVNLIVSSSSLIRRINIVQICYVIPNSYHISVHLEAVIFFSVFFILSPCFCYPRRYNINAESNSLFSYCFRTMNIHSICNNEEKIQYTPCFIQILTYRWNWNTASLRGWTINIMIPYLNKKSKSPATSCFSWVYMNRVKWPANRVASQSVRAFESVQTLPNFLVSDFCELSEDLAAKAAESVICS